MRFIYILIFLTPVSASAQDSLLYNIFPMRSAAVCYEQIVTVDSANKNDLYNRAQSWSLTALNSPSTAVQVNDKEAGIIAYRAFFSKPYSVPSTKIVTEWKYWFLLKIQTRDGKAKATLTNISIEQGGVIFSPEEYMGRMNVVKGANKLMEQNKTEALKNFKQAHLSFEILMNSLVAALKTPADF